MWYRYFSRNGLAPLQIFANSRDKADAIIKFQYSDGGYEFNSQGSERLPGYTNLSSDPANPGPGTVVPDSGRAGLPPDVRADLDAVAPESAFRSGLRARGLNPEGPLGGLLGRQFPTAQANFSLRNFLNGAFPSEAPTTSFRDYIANRGPNASSDALQLYNQVQGGGGFSQPSLVAALTSAGIGDTEEQEGFRRNFGDVAQGAARARYSPFSARFLPSRTTLNRQFDDRLFAEGERGAGAQGVNLLKFLREQYGF